jgi:hypothetical protein
VRLVLQDGENVEMDLPALRAGPWWLDTPGRLAVTNRRVVFVSSRAPWFQPVSEFAYGEIDRVEPARTRRASVTSGFSGDGMIITPRRGKPLTVWLSQGAESALARIGARVPAA